MTSSKLRLWRLFVVGRSAVTGVFLLILLALYGWPMPQALHPLLAVVATQFVTNGAYLYLWKRPDHSFLGYLAFAIEIFLITLLIFVLGRDGHVFVLAYLWPIIIAGWLIGHQAILPLTLLSSMAYSVLFFLEHRNTLPPLRFVTSGGVSLALVLCLPYLAFLALLVWALTTEMEEGERQLYSRNQELSSVNTGLRALIDASEAMSRCHNLVSLLDVAMARIRELGGAMPMALYIAEGEKLSLQRCSSLPAAFEEHYGRVPSPFSTQEEGEEQSVVFTEASAIGLPGDGEGPNGAGHRRLLHIALRSPRRLEGMLSLLYDDREARGEEYMQVLQILAPQLGTALENVRLIDDLAHERNLLGSILANMSEAVFVMDTTGIVLLSNRAARELLEVQEGQPLPAWLQKQLEAESAESRGGHRLIEHKERMASLSIAPLAVNNQPEAGAIYVARDVTPEVRADQLKSDFVAYVSHELRTPLTTINTLVRLLQKGVAPSSKQYEYLQVISAQIARQKRLIKNLLDLARLEAGRYELPPEAVDPHLLLSSVVRGCLPLAEEKGLHVELICPQELVPFVSNRGGLEQVLTNLLSNAIKFTDPGGRIVVSCSQEESQVRLAVRDTGIGMTPEEIGRVFNKFHTVHNPGKRGEGSGLGLAISAMIMKELGGGIEVRSEVGVGSCFTAWLPLVRAAGGLSAQNGRAPLAGVSRDGARPLAAGL